MVVHTAARWGRAAWSVRIGGPKRSAARQASSRRHVQAVHLDTDFYDTHYRPGAYLATHPHHREHWHADHAQA